MANYDVSEKWSPLQFGALMRKMPSNALKIIFMIFLKIIECKYMYLNGYENNLHLLDQTVFMIDYCDSYNYAWWTSCRKIQCLNICFILFCKMRIMLRCLYER